MRGPASETALVMGSSPVSGLDVFLNYLGVPVHGGARPLQDLQELTEGDVQDLCGLGGCDPAVLVDVDDPPVEPILDEVPDEMKFAKGGIVDLGSRPASRGIEDVIRKYRRDGWMD